MAILGFSQNGCASSKKADVKKTSAPSPIVTGFFGKVALVNAEARFVLIDGGYSVSPEIGTSLKTYSGESETGTLTVSAERRRPFVIADIASGTPKKGDRVVPAGATEATAKVDTTQLAR